VSDTTLNKGAPPRAAAIGTPHAPAHGAVLSVLYDQYWGELCNYINKAFGSGPPEPEDVAQTAFMKFASLENPQEIHNPRAFLYTAARNTVIDHKRREQTQQSHANDITHNVMHNGVDQISPERVLLEKERLRIIQTAVAAMPEKQSHVFLLSTLEGCCYAEISRRTGVPRSSVRRYVVKALAACETALEAAVNTSSNDGSS